MRGQAFSISLSLLACLTHGQDTTVPDPVFSIPSAGGLRIEVPDVSGLTEVDIHFSINKPVPGVAAADYNIIIREQTGGVWAYEDPAITAVVGDTIYYWILVIVNGEGHQKTDQSFTIEAATDPTTTSTTATTTTTTQATASTTTTTTTTTTTPGVEIPTVKLAMIKGAGLQMWVEDVEGLEHVAFHFSVNEPLEGIDYGQENIEISEVGPDGTWSHSWPGLGLADGDTVHYWYYLVIDRHGYQMTDNSWTVGATTTPQPTGPTTEPGTTIPTIVSVTESNRGKYFSPGQLIFDDEFEFLDLDNWQHEITMGGGGNWEFEMYTKNKTNSYTRDGILYMKPTLTSDRFGEEFLTSEMLDIFGGQPGNLCTMNSNYGCLRNGSPDNIINPIMSSRLRSVHGFSFMYGKVEARAKMPRGDWIWPAIWMLPKQLVYGQWPASGEIDIMESRGNLDASVDGVNIGAEQVGHTLHYGGGFPMNGWPNAHCEKNTASGQGFDNDFHTFGIDWTPSNIAFYVDGEEVCNIEPPQGGFWELGEWHETDMESPWTGGRNPLMSPFDEQFFLVMNVAVGGTGYFPDEAVYNAGKPWSNESPTATADFYRAKESWYPTWNPEENNGEDAAMAVDYVKVWASDVVRED